MNSSPFNPNGAASKDSGIFGLLDQPDDAGVVLIPVPWEATVSYQTGTKEGPVAILNASRQIDLFDRDIDKPYAGGIAMVSPVVGPDAELTRAAAVRVIDHLENPNPQDLQRVNSASQEMNQLVRDSSLKWMTKGKTVGIVGGDHSVPLGAYHAAAEVQGEFGILHFDAHHDLRKAYEGFTYSHASIFYNALEEIPRIKKLVQVGIRDFCEDEYLYMQNSDGRIVTFYDSDIARELAEGTNWIPYCQRIVSCLPNRVWISIDIDGLDPVNCPNTGTPVPGGLSFNQAVLLLLEVVRSGRQIIGFDLVEVSPGPDNEWDANVGARLLYKLCGIAQISRKQSRLLSG